MMPEGLDRGQGNAPQEREEMSRRSFLRRSAEVAAWSLFGVLGLDAVMERVQQRMAEVQGVNRLADQVTQDLHRSSVAYADPHCP